MEENKFIETKFKVLKFNKNLFYADTYRIFDALYQTRIPQLFSKEETMQSLYNKLSAKGSDNCEELNNKLKFLLQFCELVEVEIKSV